MTRAAAVLALSMLCASVYAMSGNENVIYPANSGAINVVTQCGLDNTGRTDVSDTLQGIIDANNRWVVIYLPNGTYRVSKTISWLCNPTPTNSTRGPVMLGQSRKGTVIRLTDGTMPATGTISQYLDGNAGHPGTPVIKTGDGIAQNFNRGLHNLTVSTGRNNPGAIGVFFYGNNMGLMSNIDIISEDGQGWCGLDLSEWAEQGPCGVTNVYVRGFEIGAYCEALNIVAIRQLSLEGQRQYGLINQRHVLAVDSLTIVNTGSIQPISNTLGGRLTLADVRIFANAPTKSGIINGGLLFARNVTTTGCAGALSGRSGANITEYTSATPRTLFSTSPAVSMNLPTKYPPEPAWEQDTGKWANLEAYKVVGPFQPRRTDIAAIQMAIDDPAKTSVLIPGGKSYSFTDTVFVRGNKSRITGTCGVLGGGPLVILDGTAPVVKLERISGVRIIVRTSRTVVIESIDNDFLDRTDYTTIADGTGDLYITDGVTSLRVINPLQKVWAWHYNSEQQHYAVDQWNSSPVVCSDPAYADINPNVRVDAGTVRFFGFKSEVCGTKILSTGGWFEMLGFLTYSGCMDKSGDPWMVVRNGNFSIGAASQTNFCGTEYRNLVQETRGSETKTLTSATNGGYEMALFTAYDPTSAAGHPGRTRVAETGSQIHAVGRTSAGLAVTYSVTHSSTATIRVLDVAGRTVACAGPMRVNAGTHRQQLTSSRTASGVYCVEVTAGSSKATVRVPAVAASGY